jgi:hypothetical protein
MSVEFIAEETAKMGETDPCRQHQGEMSMLAPAADLWL